MMAGEADSSSRWIRSREAMEQARVKPEQGYVKGVKGGDEGEGIWRAEEEEDI